MLLLVLVFAVLGLPSNQAVAEKNVLKIGTGVDVVSLDPHKYKTTPDLVVDNLIFENLVAYDHNLNVVPVLATSWERIDDLRWKFKLRKGAKFHDGTPFNAQAAKINLDRVRVAPRGMNYFGMIESVGIEDDYTILIKTKERFAPFLRNLCIPIGGMISPKAIETHGEDIAHHPVGTGHFKFKEWRPKERLVLERNDVYWGEKAKLEKVIFVPIPEEGTRAMAFESGEIDVISDALPHRIPKYKADPKINVITGPATRNVWIGFNVGDKMLSNVKLRQAIAHGINRDKIVEYVLEGLAINAQAFIPEIVMKSKKKFNFDYDPKKAKDLLNEAGYPTGVEMSIWTPEGRYLKDRQIAEAVQAQLSQIGIKVNVRVMEWAALMDAFHRHEHQLGIFGWGWATGDPEASLRACFHSKSTWNWSDYKRPKIDTLLDEAVSTLDTEKRWALYEELQQLLIDEAVAVPIYHKLNIFAASKKVKNFYPTPLEFIDISKTTVE